jgi:cysteine protease ATG4
VQDEPPNWPSDNDSYMGFESFSDPDAEEMDEEEGGEGSSARSEGYGSGDEFFDASAGRSHPSRSPSRSPHDDSDDDDSSVPDPVTPGAGRSPYALSSVDKPHAPEPDDIEDDWVDPSVPTPATSPEPSPQPENAPLPLDGSRVAVSPSASSFVPVQMSESATTVKNAAAPAGSSAEKRRKGSRGSVRASKHAQEPSYPFPVSASQDSALDEPDLHEAERSTDSPEHGGPARRMPQMRTAVARDGGRTKSGGVRGIPADPS